MNVADSIRARIRAAAASGDPAPLLQGRWAPLVLSLDATTGERLNAGVVFFGNDGQITVRTAERFERLRCLFDDRIDVDAVASLVDYAAAIVQRSGADALCGFSPQIGLGPLRPIQGVNAASIAEDLLEQVVPLARPRAGAIDEATTFMAISTPQVATGVVRWLRETRPALAQRIVAQNPLWQVSEGDTRHTLELPLRRPGHAAGVIVSAWTKSQPTLELNLLRAGIHLATLHRHVPAEQRALFVLRPGRSDGLSAQDEARLDEVFDANAWQLVDDGVVIEQERTVEQLGLRVMQWDAWHVA